MSATGGDDERVRLSERLRGIGNVLPLVVGGAVASAAALLTTVLVARVLTTRGYGIFVELLSLFLVLSMPGSALLVGVVRRVTAWDTSGDRNRVAPWLRRVHRLGLAAVGGLVVLAFALRGVLAGALSLGGSGGIVEILTAGGVWVLVSVDRGALQARQDYRGLSVNLVLEGVVRMFGVVALAAAFGVQGAATGVLVAEIATAVHARIRVAGALTRGPAPGETHPPDVGQVPPSLPADIAVAFFSLGLLALLQNADVLVLGSRAPHVSGQYAAISVPAKSLVFWALMLGNYMLPEAAIRWRTGSHALRQLAHTLLLVAPPCALLLALAIAVPRQLLSAVFGPKYTAAASAFAPLVLAMTFLAVTFVLSTYVLGVGRRWIAPVLGVGVVALFGATYAAGGHPLATARADLAVQGALLAGVTTAFVVMHRRAHRAL
jgi:O-antigen/teichoic acid export membrane protein